MTKKELISLLEDVVDEAIICVSIYDVATGAHFHNDIENIIKQKASSGFLNNDEVYLFVSEGRM